MDHACLCYAIDAMVCSTHLPSGDYFRSLQQVLCSTLENFSTSVFSVQCVRLNESSRYRHDVRPSVCPSVSLSVWDGRAL